MKQLFVIGDPVAHSLSPLLHQAMIDQTGAAYRYDVRTVLVLSSTLYQIRCWMLMRRL